MIVATDPRQRQFQSIDATRPGLHAIPRALTAPSAPPYCSALVQLPDFYAVRTTPVGRHALADVFLGIDLSPALAQAIPDATRRADIIAHAIADVCADGASYMRVSEEDGRVLVRDSYLRGGPLIELYLDLVHELTHVRQFREGADLYDRSVPYVDRPTEIEAYEVAVAEARRIGLPEEWLHAYLDVHWVTEDERLRLAARLGLRGGA
jgi:hypothetical protein